jgi:hypothetical protein
VEIEKKKMKKKSNVGQALWWLTPVILTTQKAEIKKIMVQGHSRQMFTRLYLENIQQSGLRVLA